MVKLILAVLSFPVLYALFSFVFWETDPSSWSEDARTALVMVVFATVFGVLTCPYLPDIQQERDQ